MVVVVNYLIKEDISLILKVLVNGFSMYFKLGIYFISCLCEISLQELILKPDYLKSLAIKDAPKYWFMFLTKLLNTNIKNLFLEGNRNKSSLLKYNFCNAHSIVMQYSMKRALTFENISCFNSYQHNIREKRGRKITNVVDFMHQCMLIIK